MMKPVSPMGIHLKLNATQFKQLTQTQKHPLYHLYAHPKTTQKHESHNLHNNDYTIIIISDPDITPEECKKNSWTFTLPSPHHTAVPEKIT